MWEKGESGNPAGRPLGPKPFLAALERAIAQDDAKKLRGAAEKLLAAADAGTPWAITELADRLDGKPTQQVDQRVSGTLTATLVSGDAKL